MTSAGAPSTSAAASFTDTYLRLSSTSRTAPKAVRQRIRTRSSSTGPPASSTQAVPFVDFRINGPGPDADIVVSIRYLPIPEQSADRRVFAPQTDARALTVNGRCAGTGAAWRSQARRG